MAAPFLLWLPEPTKDVPAEYPYLAGKKVCVVVWAEPDTLFEYPHVQREVSEHVAEAMRQGFKTADVASVSFVPNQQVVEFQGRNPRWDRMHPAEIGERFAAERVLMIELTQYTTREPDAGHLYRGRIAANVKVYDTAYPGSTYSYRAAIEVAYPPESHGAWGTDDRGILKATLELFASEVAGKFYDRKVKIR